MLFVHTFNISRGTDVLPIIAQKIKDDRLDILILAIGRPGDYSLELDKKIEINHLQDCIINLGQVPNKDISKFYQIADLFIMPSRGEGFPRVLLEAMACGCPTLSFNVGGVPNILSAATLEDLLIPVNEDQKFVEKSLNIINDEALLVKLSHKSQEKAAHFGTDNIVKMYVDCLSLLDKV